MTKRELYTAYRARISHLGDLSAMAISAIRIHDVTVTADNPHSGMSLQPGIIDLT